MELEFAFRSHDNYRVAEVALVPNERWDSVNPKGNFEGSPELAIEVLPPSSTEAKLLDKETLCLENGCREFWVVDLDRQKVKVSTPNGSTVANGSGQEIPLYFANGAKFAVDAIFA